MLDIDFIRDSLLGKTFISAIYHFDEIDSTNNYAKKLKDEDNVLVLAEYQSGGKGRFDRKWDSEKGMNLTFTIKKKFNINANQNSYINFYFSYFLYEAIWTFLEENAKNISTDLLKIKWPNDILFDSKKISGILIESVLNKNDYMIGIGLNVNQKKFNDKFIAASLINYTNDKVDLNALLIKIINVLDKNLHLLDEAKFDKIYELWKKSTDMIGKNAEFVIDLEI